MAIQAHLPKPPWSPTITIKLVPLRDHLFGDAKLTSVVLVAGSMLFLLIASTNVGSLSFVRLMQRDRELAIRRVLGAERGRIISQLITESIVLACPAALAGLLITAAVRALLVAFGPYRTGIYGHLSMDWRVLVFAGGLLVLVVLVFGIVPALRVSDFRLAEAVAAGQTSIAGKRNNLRFLSAIGAAQIAIVIALAASAALMLKSFWNMRYRELGFDSQHAIAATLNLGNGRYAERHREFGFIRQLLERTAAIPGVEAVAATTASEIPPGGGHAMNTVRIEGRPLPINSRQKPLQRPQIVNAAYFNILRIPLLEGRLLLDSDRANSTPVVVVNKQFAKRYFPGESVVGHRLQNGELPDTWYTVVGVVGDAKTSGLAAHPEPVVYTPFEQSDGSRLRDLGVVIRSALPVSAVAPEFVKLVHQLDTEQPISTIETIDDRLNESVSRPRFTAGVLFAFSCLGTMLAMIGVYGVLACRARAQMREIAMRQALGAEPRDVIAYLLKHALRILCAGGFGGLVLALVSNRLFSNLLFEIKPTDPGALSAVCAAVVAAAFVASFLPAFRASRLDPLVSLRQE